MADIPGTTVGVIGGGQLGRMLGEASSPLGVEIIVSDPTPDAPAAPVVRDQIVGAFDDEQTVRTLAERVDVLTYEIELTDPEILERVSNATGTPVHPHPETLRMIQDKLVQKRRLQKAGLPVPAFRSIDTVDELESAVDELGPVMVKARTGGYDGRGNVPVRSRAEAARALDGIEGPAMAEELLEFDRELAVIGCRGESRETTFPVTETVHEDEILRTTITPARTTERIQEHARDTAQDVLGELSGRGVYGIELFENDGEILVNEIAPRPHNSGHWTIEGCHTSQFEQHIRAVIGAPLGTTERRSPTATANILGDGTERRPAALQGVREVLEYDRLAVHWYGKREVYPLRKMGHLTLVGDETATPEQLLAGVRTALKTLSFR